MQAYIPPIPLRFCVRLSLDFSEILSAYWGAPLCDLIFVTLTQWVIIREPSLVIVPCGKQLFACANYAAGSFIIFTLVVRLFPVLLRVKEDGTYLVT